MGKKKRNLNRAGNMDVDAWRRRQIAKRVKKRLEDETERYAQEYAQKNDNELAALVRRKAAALGRMPHPLEIPGGAYLHKRLGNWDVLARAIGYAPVGARPGRTAYNRIVKEESERFAAERRARKEEKLRKRIARAKNNGNAQQ